MLIVRILNFIKCVIGFLSLHTIYKVKKKKKEMYNLIWKPVKYILGGFVLYPGKNEKETNKTALLTVQPLRPMLGTPTRGGRVAGVSCHSILRWNWLVFFIFLVLHPPPPESRGWQSVEGGALWLKRGDLSLNRGFGIPTPQGDPITSTTWVRLWGRRWGPVLSRSSCSTFPTWPGCASRTCTYAK